MNAAVRTESRTRPHVRRMARKTVSNFHRSAQSSEGRVILRDKPDCGMF
jgi:hypothetical protein